MSIGADIAILSADAAEGLSMSVSATIVGTVGALTGAVGWAVTTLLAARAGAVAEAAITRGRGVTAIAARPDAEILSTGTSILALTISAGARAIATILTIGGAL